MLIEKEQYSSIFLKNLWQSSSNKAFKSDSQRLAFFVPSLGFVFMVVWLGFVVALLTYMVSPCFASQ